MRAVRFHGPDQGIVIEDVEAPVAGPGQVVVDVAAAGVCGTELHFLDGLLTPARLPITLGHEVAGTIAAVGDRVSGVGEGQRVAVHYFHPCGRCERCRAGDDHLCDTPLGFLAFATDGGFAEQVVVPASAVVPVPEPLGLVEAASLCCSATTALHATAVADVSATDTAIVYGVGGVGLALVQVLHRAGARVVAVARSDTRLAKARELGAHVTVNAGRRDVAAAVREATDGAGAEVVFELVGTQDTGAAALGCLAKAGAVVYVGYSFDQISFSPLAMVVPEQRILTSVSNRRSELVDALRLGADGSVHSPTTTAPLDNAIEVLDALRAGRIVGRAVLTP